MKTLTLFVLGILLGGLLAAGVSHAADTTISYKGQPVPSAMAPSMSAFSQDVCGIGVSGAVNAGGTSTNGGVSGGRGGIGNGAGGLAGDPGFVRFIY